MSPIKKASKGPDLAAPHRALPCLARPVRESGGDQGEMQDAIDNIEAGRIRFSELTLGSLLGRCV